MSDSPVSDHSWAGSLRRPASQEDLLNPSVQQSYNHSYTQPVVLSYSNVRKHSVNQSSSRSLNGRRIRSASVCSDLRIGGEKVIDYWGSVALLVNNVTGGGLVLFASVYQSAGWLVTTGCLLLLMLLCGLGGVMLVECMAMMPNNGQFQRRIEYTTAVSYYVRRPYSSIIAVFYQLSLTVTNLSLIVQSAQVMDFLIARVSGKICAFPRLAPDFAFACVTPIHGNITPFATHEWLVPLGLLCTALVVIPLGMFNLNDNIRVQKAAFVSLLAILCCWLVVMGSHDPVSNRVPAIGTSFNAVLGTSLFNFAFLTSVPSWLNEKRPDVSIIKVMSSVLPLSVLAFIVIGWLGGVAFEPWHSTETLLDKIKATGWLGEVTFYAFPIVVNLTSIPVLSIFQRYNLIKERVCGKKMANFLAVILPWLIAIPLYNGNGYSNLVSWGGVCVTSVVNFIVPAVLYIIAVSKRENDERIVHDTEAVIDEMVDVVEESINAESLTSIKVNGRSSKLAGLSVDDAVAWTKQSRDINGLRSTPHTSFSSTVDGASQERSLPVTPSSTQSSPLSAQPSVVGTTALQWATEHDVSASDRDQPNNGSFKTGSASRSQQNKQNSTELRHVSSQTNLLANDHSSSFSRSRPINQSVNEVGVEMTALRTRTKMFDDSLDFLDTEAIQVEEVDVSVDIDLVRDGSEHMNDRMRKISTTESLPTIDELPLDSLEAKIAVELAVDAALADENVVDLIHDDDAGYVWHVVSPQYLKYRIPVAVAVLATMLTICGFAFVEQIIYQIANPFW